MRIRLIPIAGVKLDAPFTVRPNSCISLGRSPRNEIVIQDPGTSRIHCRMANTGVCGLIADCGSRNATRLNDQPITHATPLRTGDIIGLGGASLAVEIEGAPTDSLAPVAVSEAEPGEASIGEDIAGCRIEERLGNDRLSVTYVARQLAMERTVRLRVLRPSLRYDTDAVELFVNAARAAGRLLHPHILRVYDAGEYSGIPYAIIEQPEDGSAAELVKAPGQGIPWDEAADLGDRLAAALEYARTHDAAHGAITPATIQFCRQRMPKLADFGFARALLGGETPLFPPPETCATPFAAPEILMGVSADSGSDVYSLGATLYWLLSGDLPRPCPDKDLRKRLTGQTAAKVAAARVADIVVKAMELDPAARPSAVQMHQEFSAGGY